MKKTIMIVATAIICVLATINVTVALSSNGEIDVSLKNVEALSWIEDGYGNWIPEPGDDPEDHNNHPENNLLEYNTSDCVVCRQYSGWVCIDYQIIIRKFHYCGANSSSSSCNQFDVDSADGTEPECIEPYNWD